MCPLDPDIVSAEVTNLKRVAMSPLNVRFGSKADMCAAKRHVRFTPESGHVRCKRAWAQKGTFDAIGSLLREVPDAHLPTLN